MVCLCGRVLVTVGVELCTNELNSYCDRFTPILGTKWEWNETEDLRSVCMCPLHCDISPLNSPEINVGAVCIGSKNVDCLRQNIVFMQRRLTLYPARGSIHRGQGKK
jgi:hypothetical protein